MMTSAGSLALASSAPKDAELVTRLRAAGAIILGKTNLSEWANFPIQPLDQRMERTRRPDPQSLRARSQSIGIELRIRSGGRRVSLRRGGRNRNRRFYRFAFVDQRNCRHQADGRIDSRRGHRPHFASPGHCGSDGADSRGCRASARRARRCDLCQALDPNGLKGARIGVARQVFGFNDHVDRVIGEAIETLKKLGAEVIDPPTSLLTPS